MNTTVKTFHQYIKNYPKDVQVILKKVRETVLSVAPDAEEMISYGMPGFKTHGKHLVYFAAFKKHIGFYAMPSGNVAFKKETAQYKQGKGSIQFPLDQPIPYALIKKIVVFRVKENAAQAKARKL